MLIRQAATEADLDDVRSLLRAFTRWHRETFADQLPLIDRYFDNDAYEAELRALPGNYAPPAGALLLATIDGAAAGCVAMKRIDDGRCEMKRMYVDRTMRRAGVGRALAAAILEAGALGGYGSMYLDTSVRQVEALSLYRSLGFRPVEPYYEIEPELEGWLTFMARSLSL